MHVVQISFYSDPQGRSAAELHEAWPSLVDVAEAVANAGARVTVIQAAARREHLVRNGVDYHFVPAEPGVRSIALSPGFAELVAKLGPDVFHVHGLLYATDVARLTKLFPTIPILLQDHASRPPRPWYRHLWRRGFSRVGGVAFCAAAQAEEFRSQSLIPRKAPIFEIPESTSRFTPGDQSTARRATRICGAPAMLWVGHLNANKDPLTVLDGVSAAAREFPELQLWCCFGTAPLLGQVEERVANDPLLRSRVHLLGTVPHERIEALMRAADVFVLGSHREGSGYSVIEALACGLPPVVTDIPSFRSLTGQGRVGQLWRRGNAQSLCEALLAVAKQPMASQRAAARQHFEEHLSSAAVGRKLLDAYLQLTLAPRAQSQVVEPC